MMLDGIVALGRMQSLSTDYSQLTGRTVKAEFQWIFTKTGMVEAEKAMMKTNSEFVLLTKEQYHELLVNKAMMTE